VTPDFQGERYFPAFYADPAYQRSQLEAVTKVLRELPGGAKLQFFLSRRGSLGGATAQQALAKGKLQNVNDVAAACICRRALTAVREQAVLVKTSLRSAVDNFPARLCLFCEQAPRRAPSRYPTLQITWTESPAFHRAQRTRQALRSMSAFQARP
jgi:hypothetical protein